MTLIITAATANKVVQASDRRLVRPTDGSIVDDNANKAICVGCIDAHFSIAYTGVASIGRGQRTDEWLLECLISIQAFGKSVGSIGKALNEQASMVFGRFPKEHRKTTFIFSGYKHRVPFTMIVSNFERDGLLPFREAQDRFSIYTSHPKARIVPAEAYRIAIHGTREAVNNTIRQRIRQLIRRNYFQEKESTHVADKLVSIIRQAARTSRFGQYIGRNCMTVSMTPNPDDGFVFRYHPDKASPYVYGPHLILRPGIAIKSIEGWTGKGDPPWRNTTGKT